MSLDQDLDSLRTALEGLREEIHARFPSERALAGRPGLDWIKLAEELRRRISAFGMSERSGEVDEFGMDEVVLQSNHRLLDFLHDTYWRVDLYGAEDLPADGPVLFVANHSGLLPYDGLLLTHALQRRRPDWPRPRFLLADWLVTLPYVQPFLARLGGVRACRENADRLLAGGRSVIAFPEGAKGATKTFRERYRLKRFGRGGVVRTAIENGVPLVPVGIVGAEEAHPMLFKWQLPARALGLPFLPVTPTFPLLGPAGLLPLPSKWIISLGRPLEIEDAGEADDPLRVSRLNEALRRAVDERVNAALGQRESVWG